MIMLDAKYKSFFDKVKQEIAVEIAQTPQFPMFCMLGNADKDHSEIHMHFMSDPDAFRAGVQMRACQIEADFFIAVIEAPMLYRKIEEGETFESVTEEMKHRAKDAKQSVMLYFEDLKGNTYCEIAEVSKDRKLSEWEALNGMEAGQGQMDFLELRRNPEKAQILEAIEEKKQRNPTLH